MAGSDLHTEAIWWLFAALCVGMGVLSLARAGGVVRRVGRFLGDLTYLLYLNHFVIVVLFIAYAPRNSNGTYIVCVATAA